LQDTKDMLIITGFYRGLTAKRQGLSSASARSRNMGGQEALAGSNRRRLGRLGSRARCAGSRGDRGGVEDVLTTAEIDGDGRNRRRMAAVLAARLLRWRSDAANRGRCQQRWAAAQAVHGATVLQCSSGRGKRRHGCSAARRI
jgi:hypothetical protein